MKHLPIIGLVEEDGLDAVELVEEEGLEVSVEVIFTPKISDQTQIYRERDE